MQFHPTRTLLAITLLSSAAVAGPPRSQCGSDPVSKSTYLKSSSPGASDYFGVAIAASGDTLVVGAPGEDSAATGIGGDPSDNSARNAGAVFVYHRTGLFWTLRNYLKASNTDPDDQFGAAVAIDGDTIVVGAPGEDSPDGAPNSQTLNTRKDLGAAYVFRQVAGTWIQEAYLKPLHGTREDHFGASVAIRGNRILVGAPGEDGIPGDPSSNARTDSGAAYVFERALWNWSQVAYLKAENADAGDAFGSSVALDSTFAFVGAPLESGSAVGVGGDPSSNGATYSGAVYTFLPDAMGGWTQDAYLKSSNSDPLDRFGNSVSADGGRLVVGAPREDSAATGVGGDSSSNTATFAGAAYVFVHTPLGWVEEAYLKASNTDIGDFFGTSVALRGDRVLVGAWSESSAAAGVNGDDSDNSAPNAGAAYLFERSAGQWSQSAYIKASSPDAQDNFGWAVALSDRLVAAGARFEDGGESGVAGNEEDNSKPDAGAAYGFVLPHMLQATATVRQGKPANPLALFSRPSLPVISQTWKPFVSHALFAPSASLDLLLVSVGSPVNLSRPAGTLLCDPTAQHQVYVAQPGSPFAIPIPDDCALLGTRACTQAASFTPGVGLELTNALDIVIGSM